MHEWLLVLSTVLLASLAGCGGEVGSEEDDSEVSDSNERSIMSYGCARGGVRVWEHASFSGRTAVFCEGWHSDLRNYRTGLNASESWNDRISSWMVFGATRTRKLCFRPYRNINFGGPLLGCYSNGLNECSLEYHPYDNDTYSSLKIVVGTSC